MESAVFDLRAIASKALDAATTKVEVADLAGRISNLLNEVGMKQDAHKSLKGIRVSGERC